MCRSIPWARVRNMLRPLLAAVALGVSMYSTACSSTSADEEGKAMRGSGNSTLKVVRCVISGQIRPLGPRSTYVSRSQAIETTPEDCTSRGGRVISLNQPANEKR